MITAATGFAAVALTHAPELLMAMCLPAYLGGFGPAKGNAVAAAFTAVSRAAGTASAIIGFSQFALAGISTATVGAGNTPLPTSLSIAFGICLTFVVTGYLVSRQHSSTDPSKSSVR